MFGDGIISIKLDWCSILQTHVRQGKWRFSKTHLKQFGKTVFLIFVE